VSPYRIPNVEFGSWGERNSIRMFFPGLYDWNTHPSPKLTQTEQKVVYNSGIGPAMRRLMSHAANKWPLLGIDLVSDRIYPEAKSISS
jgi:hypothetical protein